MEKWNRGEFEIVTSSVGGPKKKFVSELVTTHGAGSEPLNPAVDDSVSLCLQRGNHPATTTFGYFAFRVGLFGGAQVILLIS